MFTNYDVISVSYIYIYIYINDHQLHLINNCIFLPVGLQTYVSVVFSVLLISTKSVTQIKLLILNRSVIVLSSHVFFFKDNTVIIQFSLILKCHSCLG